MEERKFACEKEESDFTKRKAKILQNDDRINLKMGRKVRRLKF